MRPEALGGPGIGVREVECRECGQPVPVWPPVGPFDQDEHVGDHYVEMGGYRAGLCRGSGALARGQERGVEGVVVEPPVVDGPPGDGEGGVGEERPARVGHGDVGHLEDPQPVR